MKGRETIYKHNHGHMNKGTFIVSIIVVGFIAFMAGSYLTASPAPDLTPNTIQKMNQITGMHKPTTNAELIFSRIFPRN